jgi:hypothetical protein
MNNSPGNRGAEPGDEAMLALIRSVFEAVDPVPPGLAERVRFSVALAGIEGELASLAAEPEAGQLDEHDEPVALARGALEESRTITFDSTELTIMIRIDSNADGSARVDGWLAPPRRCRVEIGVIGGLVTADADDDGRFAFPSVPRGTVRIVVRPPEREGTAGDSRGTGKAVITPALVL